MRGCLPGRPFAWGLTRACPENAGPTWAARTTPVAERELNFFTIANRIMLYQNNSH
jgi:hypothetical protein